PARVYRSTCNRRRAAARVPLAENTTSWVSLSRGQIASGFASQPVPLFSAAFAASLLGLLPAMRGLLSGTLFASPRLTGKGLFPSRGSPLSFDGFLSVSPSVRPCRVTTVSPFFWTLAPSLP